MTDPVGSTRINGVLHGWTGRRCQHCDNFTHVDCTKCGRTGEEYGPIPSETDKLIDDMKAKGVTIDAAAVQRLSDVLNASHTNDATARQAVTEDDPDASLRTS